MESINNNRSIRIVRSFEKMANNEQIDWGHWIYRLVALIIDSIIAGIIGGIIFVIIFGFSAPWWASTFVSPLFFGIVLVLYSTFLEATWNGMTVGKKLLGLQVQTTNGGNVTLDKAFIRNLFKFYWLLILLDWLLGILTPGNKRQKYFDRVAGTIVVQNGQSFGTAGTPPPPPPPPPT
jgi:uncharacterized RDD family membrane protein YckC